MNLGSKKYGQNASLNKSWRMGFEFLWIGPMSSYSILGWSHDVSQKWKNELESSSLVVPTSVRLTNKEVDINLLNK